MKNLNLQKIKAVIFDFDETLYSGGDWSKYYNYCTGAFIKEGMFENAQQVFDELKRFCPTNENFGFRVAKYLKMKNIDIGFYRSYLNDNIYDFMTDNVTAVDDELLKLLKKKYKMFMISDSPKSHVDFYMDKFGLSQEHFDEVYLNSFREGDFTKKFYMNQIMEKHHLKPDEVLMIGDSALSDMKPAKELGLQHFQVFSTNDTKNIINSLLNA